MVDILSDLQRQAEQVCLQGIELYEEDKNPQEAHKIFLKAYEMDPTSAKVNSWLGLTYAVVERKVQKGMDMCRKAIESNVPDAMFYRNIAKLYLMLNNKRAAMGAFAKGLQIDKGNKAILNEWKPLGFRRKTFFSWLERGHWINVQLGKFTWWLAHRNDKK